MRTRNADKSPAVSKKMHPKSALERRNTPPSSSPAPPNQSASPAETATRKTASAAESNEAPVNDPPKPSVTDKRGNVSGEMSEVALVAKGSGTRIVKRKVIKRVVKKKVPIVRKNPMSDAVDEEAKIEEATEENAGDDMKNNDAVDENISGGIVGGSVTEEENVDEFENPLETAELVVDEPEKHSVGNREELSVAMKPMDTDEDSVKGQKGSDENEKDELEEKREESVNPSGNGDTENTTLVVEDNYIDSVEQVNASMEDAGNERIEGLSDQEVHEEFGGEDFTDDDVAGEGAHSEALEEENVQLNAAAREHKIRKATEIFVHGLDRDAVVADIKKVFEDAGEIVDVRMHVDPLTNKNKGFAFVQFATKIQANRVLSEMKNPVIHGKRCRTAPSEDNDVLFLGNISKTWTKEAIKQKLNDYGIEGVESINLVLDPRHEGLSRGFAFIEFTCHADAMLAYKRLQKPDVVLGHSERTAKVAFAEPLREPDPKVMARVKSVFVDGIPSHWDENHVRKRLKAFGGIARVMLARNMPTAKRNDFASVDFNTHEAAVSCVEGINNNGLLDGKSKVKVRVRLSNPLPKLQAVKSGMAGGLLIGYGSRGTYPRSSGRGFGRGRHHLDRRNFQYDRVFYHRGRGNGGRMGIFNEHEFHEPYPPFHRRENFGRGARWGSRGAPENPPLHYSERLRYGATARGYDNYDPYRRQPYSFEGGYDRSFMERRFDESYPYEDVPHGIQRPHYMMDEDPEFQGPSRHHPRLDYLDHSVSVHGSRYRDDMAPDDFCTQDYRFTDHHGSDYGGRPFSPFYGRGRDRRYGCDRAHGRGYYH